MKHFAARLLMVLCILFTSIIGYVQYHIQHPPQNLLFVQKQIWAHRGMYPNLTENTIPAMQAALQAGATGIETDIFYDDSLQDFVVSHDYPYIMPNGKLLLLDEVLAALNDSAYYWLDLKNLNATNAQILGTKLHKLLDKYHAVKRAYIESGDVLGLEVLADEDLKTIYWVQYNRNGVSRVLKLWYSKAAIDFGRFDAISTAYYLFDNDFRSNFAQYPTFVFHAYTKKSIEDCLVFPQVAVILADSSQYYRMNNTNKK